MKPELLYRCPICQQVYSAPAMAQRCIDKGRGEVPWGVTVGDLVWCRSEEYTGEIKGDQQWCIHQMEGGPWYPIFVVTNITPGYLDRHSQIIHLASGLGNFPGVSWAAKDTLRLIKLPPVYGCLELNGLIGRTAPKDRIFKGKLL